MSSETLSGRFAEAVGSLLSMDSSVPSIEDDGVRSSGLGGNELTEEIECLWTEAMAAGCISRNEVVEDVSTKDLKYVLLPFYVGKALSQVVGCESQGLRRDALEKARSWQMMFQDLVSSLEILKKSEIEALSRGPPQNPGERREYLIANLKREKEEKRKLEELKLRRDRVDSDMLEEVEREVTLSVIETAARQSGKEVRSLDEELTLLKYAEETKAKGKDPAEEARKMRQNAPPPQSYRIIDTKKYQQEQVFKPSHTLPTYTVEEWGEIEAARMREQTKKEEEMRREKALMDDEDSDRDSVSDQKTMEARDWDEFTDNNNKGSGNTLG